MNKKYNIFKTRKDIRRIAEETKEEKTCKHQWKIHEVNTWWMCAVYLYCPKCGSWKEIL